MCVYVACRDKKELSHLKELPFERTLHAPYIPKLPSLLFPFDLITVSKTIKQISSAHTHPIPLVQVSKANLILFHSFTQSVLLLFNNGSIIIAFVVAAVLAVPNAAMANG